MTPVRKGSCEATERSRRPLVDGHTASQFFVNFAKTKKKTCRPFCSQGSCSSPKEKSTINLRFGSRSVCCTNGDEWMEVEKASAEQINTPLFLTQCHLQTVRWAVSWRKTLYFCRTANNHCTAGKHGRQKRRLCPRLCVWGLWRRLKACWSILSVFLSNRRWAEEWRPPSSSSPSSRRSSLPSCVSFSSGRDAVWDSTP